MFDYYCIGRLNVVVIFLPWTSRTHRDYSHKGESLVDGCRCIAAAVLLHTDFVDGRLSGCFRTKKTNAPLDRLVCL